MKLRDWFSSNVRNVLSLNAYDEYNGPMLEPLELYAAKSGRELASEQTYNFVDRGGRKLAIRPEMTPTVARMVAARINELNLPFKIKSLAFNEETKIPSEEPVDYLSSYTHQ